MRKFLTLEDRVVPMQHPRALIDVALAQGASLAGLLENTGITEPMLADPDARISYLTFGFLTFNALNQTGNPGLGIDFGHRIHPANMGFVGLAVISSRTAEEALRAGLEFGRVLAPAWQMALEIDGDAAVFKATPVLPLGPMHVFGTEALLVGVYEMATFVLGERPALREVSVDYPAPAYVDRYVEIAGVPFRFDQPAIEARFDASVLKQPLRGADPITRELALRYCQVEIAKLPANDGLISCVRAMLMLRPGQYADMQSIASALQTSARTLRRELARLDSSYQRLLDEARREHTLALLRTSALELPDAANALGFSDERALRRAVQRWTGSSPRVYREQQVKTGSAS